MAGEPREDASLSWAGMAGDRRWAFVRADAERNGFPWHTIRDDPLLCRYVTRLLDPERPDKSEVEVHTPTGDRYYVHDRALAAELGPGVRVMRLDRGAFDAMPVSLITTQTVAALCTGADIAEDPLRFRPNIVIAGIADQPFIEDDWVGSVLRIGGSDLRVDARDGRCVVVNVNPGSGRPDSQLLKVIGQEHAARAGVYGTVVRPGTLRVDDPVTVLA